LNRSSSFTAMSRFLSSGSALPSNMWPLNRFGWPAARRRSVSRRAHHEGVQLVRLAMVGVERDVDRIARRHAVDVFGNRDGAERHVLHRGARRERAAARRDLDDPSLLLSASPFSTALAVVSDVTLMAG
jgi:hypothetical protein